MININIDINYFFKGSHSFDYKAANCACYGSNNVEVSSLEMLLMFKCVTIISCFLIAFNKHHLNETDSSSTSKHYLIETDDNKAISNTNPDDEYEDDGDDENIDDDDGKDSNSIGARGE